ncbi:O-acetyl-ADP-ribose deacetylase [Paenibacillus glufosinatiresistens]|uniref:O-acetyl-ADP-ribose deacetylase n=1 Tax=Paenibacillus glufosinatiresistens TaxID=3070657 RepID=UPI00286E7E1C|nr:O-acetyl-ADP-ribose deacetylase [Paenibacillus sp. YX.27]
MRVEIKGTGIEAIRGDITAWGGDAIVNAANSGLFGGGGVDGAIHRAGGPAIAEECAEIRRRQGGCLPGEAVRTGPGRLGVRHLIHTVGPIWKGGSAGERDILARCYRSSLKLAAELGARSVAFPNISTGIYGFPKDEACGIALRTVADYLAAAEEETRPEEIVFICFEADNLALYEEQMKPFKQSADHKGNRGK